MKIAVIGAGIIGVTTAYELALDGHDVTVFERRNATAEEASFANAGVISPGYVGPWSAPGMLTRALGQLLRKHVAERITLPLSAAEASWLWKSLLHSRETKYLHNRSHMTRLAHYSQQRLHQISDKLELEFDRHLGHLLLLRSERDSARLQNSLAILQDQGIALRQVGPEEARRIEPGLNPDTPLHSALHLPADEVGNCRQFALLLKNEAQRLGAQFEFSTTVERIDAQHGIAVQLARHAAARRFDAAVLCAGVDSARLLRPLGLKIPLAAVHGYSVSAAIRDPFNAPAAAVMDERYKVAISRLGNRVRVAGSAELGGRPEVKRQAMIQTLYKVLDDWFPHAANWFPGSANQSSGVMVWKGARPMLPDGPPLVGPSGVANLWLNLGHGASGWALSCGSARAVADLVNGKQAEIDLQGFQIDRFGL